MSRTTKPHEDLIESFSFATPVREIEDLFNPEDDATNRLIDISS